MKLMNNGVAILPREEKKEEKINGIIVPETVKQSEKNKHGTVVAVGSGTKHEPMELSVGDKVVYVKATYPVSDGCEIVSLRDILYVE